MSRAAIFTQRDVAKLIKGVEAAGSKVTRVTIEPTGKLVADLSDGVQDNGTGKDEWAERIRAKTNQPAEKRH